MSEEILDLVVRGMRAALAHDFDTVNALYHPDHVLVTLVARGFGEAEAKGAGEYKAWLEQTDDLLSWEGEVQGAVDIGPEQVLVVSEIHIKGASSGIETAERSWALVTVSDGKIMRTDLYGDPTEALEAARPSE
jgi:ketosteroid isomerase-like protein